MPMSMGVAVAVASSSMDEPKTPLLSSGVIGDMSMMDSAVVGGIAPLPSAEMDVDAGGIPHKVNSSSNGVIGPVPTSIASRDNSGAARRLNFVDF